VVRADDVAAVLVYALVMNQGTSERKAAARDEAPVSAAGAEGDRAASSVPYLAVVLVLVPVQVIEEAAPGFLFQVSVRALEFLADLVRLQ